MEINEYIVVGSGCCGSMVAKTLIEKGIRVLMIDAGILPDKQTEDMPASFMDSRLSEKSNYDFFLGSKFESIKRIYQKPFVHLTPSRMFAIEKVSDYLAWENSEFNAIESLAKGGLGNAWGLGSFVYSKNELKEAALPVAEMEAAYKWVGNHVGISGGDDSSAEYANGNLFSPQPSIQLDFNGERIWKKIRTKKLQHKNGFVFGRTPLAISTRNEINGKKFSGSDLDFYEVGKSAAFRPLNLVIELEKTSLLQYMGNKLVLSFSEENNIITVRTRDMNTNVNAEFFCKKLILASGTLGTARVVMRSTQKMKLPVICNAYSYIPSIQLPLIGSSNMAYQNGLSQISMYYDPSGLHKNVAMGSLYSYRSLMGFRLLPEFPLGVKDGVKFLKLLQPALNITGVFHPEYGSDEKYIELIPDSTSRTGDKMKGTYRLSENEEKAIFRTEKAFKRMMLKMGLIPLKVQRNLPGASIHYSGTIPISDMRNDNPTMNRFGRLNGFQNIYIADGSGFNFLSGKGLTLSLMAFAHLVAKKSYEV